MAKLFVTSPVSSGGVLGDIAGASTYVSVLQVSWGVAGRLLACTLLPGAPFVITRLLLHQHSGVVNLDYLLLTLLASLYSVRLASVLFALTYALECTRLLDAVYFFTQQDLAFAAQFVGDVPAWLVAAWVLAAATVCTLALVLWRKLLPRVPRQQLWRGMLPLAVLATVCVGVDVGQGYNPMLVSPHGKTRPHLVGELLVRMPVELMRKSNHPEGSASITLSATSPVWSEPAIRLKRENVVVVVVESMGLLRDKDALRKEFAVFDDPVLQARYVVDEGSVPFAGPTVAGEMREECHLTTGVHVTDATLAGKQPCLPAQFRSLGYETASYHGYRGMMFRRQDWYPKLGFEEMHFLGDLKGLPTCNGAYYGVCDGDLIAAVEQRLVDKKAANAAPQFIHLMTLNGHLPIDAKDAPRRECPLTEADRDVCGQLAYTAEVLDAAKRLALDPATGPTTVIVVGDHAPPYLSPKERELFSQSRVPFVRLLPRS